jgi:hypothetical protein
MPQYQFVLQPIPRDSIHWNSETEQRTQITYTERERSPQILEIYWSSQYIRPLLEVDNRTYLIYSPDILSHDITINDVLKTWGMPNNVEFNLDWIEHQPDNLPHINNIIDTPVYSVALNQISAFIPNEIRNANIHNTNIVIEYIPPMPQRNPVLRRNNAMYWPA